uniref:Protein RER1 n=1 Tax=Vombatus ursinus TaxID=29139 RepID=A0A4X2L208_VOMUR
MALRGVHGLAPRGSASNRMKGNSVPGKLSVVCRLFARLGQIYQSWLDKSTPYKAVQWVVTLGLSFIYIIRVYLLQGWYIMTYTLGIYHFNLSWNFILSFERFQNINFGILSLNTSFSCSQRSSAVWAYT